MFPTPVQLPEARTGGNGLASQGAPASSVVSRVLRRQFRDLNRLLRRCAQGADDAHTVHRLRVATRRADAAMRCFAMLLPNRRTRKVRQGLRKLRRAAGAVRDIDVFVARLEADCNLDLPADDVLLSELRTQRDRAARNLAERAARAAAGKLSRRMRRLTRKVRWPGETAEPLFAGVTAEFLRPLFAAFRNAAGQDLTDIRQIHRLRLHGKRLRYSLELMDLDESPVTAMLRTLQERLGRVNDGATAIHLLNRVLSERTDDESTARLEQLLSAERARLAAEKRLFLEWWQKEGQREAFRVVSDNAGMDRCDAVTES